VLAPFVTHLQMDFPATGAHSAATLASRPEADDSTVVSVIVAWPAEDPAGFRQQLQLSEDVLDEDLSMLELMADPRLAVSLRDELHTRADKASVEYRRLIADQLAWGRQHAPARLSGVVAGAPGR